MNYQPLIPKSSPVTNKNNLGVTTIVFLLDSNRRRIFLPTVLTGIIGFKVKSICWTTIPAGFATSTMLFLSCDDLIENNSNQSMAILPDPTDPFGIKVDILPVSLIATWILDRSPVITSTNPQTPNFEQPILWTNREMRISDLAFNFFVNSMANVTFDITNGLFLTMEFYYHLDTSDSSFK